MHRIFFAAVVACAPMSICHAGSFVSEPGTYVLSSHQSISRDGVFTTNVSRWDAGDEPGGGGSITGGSNGDISSRAAFNMTYLGIFDLDNLPFIRADEISIELEAECNAGTGPSNRIATASSQAFASFELTQTAIVDLSGVLFSNVFSQGGISNAHFNLAVRELGSPFPLFDLVATDGDIPGSVNWQMTLEPGFYSLEIGLHTLASASGTGNEASTEVVSEFLMTFAAVPSPGVLAMLGPVCVFVGRRRR